MNKDQAFSILVQATGLIQANRETHDKIKEALSVIKAEIADKAEKKPKTELPIQE